MQIEFTYDIADFREVCAPEIFAANPEKARRVRTDDLALKVFWVIDLLVLCFERIRPHEPYSPFRDILHDFRLAFTLSSLWTALPAVLAGTYIVAIYISAIATTWQAHRDLKKPSWFMRELRGLSFLLCLGVGTWATFTQWHPQLRAPVPEAMLVATLPCCIAALLAQLLTFLQRRARIVGWWRKDPSLQRPKKVVIDEGAFHFGDSHYEVRFTWPSIARVRETKNLLVLVAEDGTPFPVPKRAFADPSDLGRCRSLLQNAVQNTKFLVEPSGFAVLPKPAEPPPEVAGTQTGPTLDESTGSL